MTFEELQKANATIKTTKIKEKDYAEVNQRIKAFRMCYPDGQISTEIDFRPLDGDEMCVCKAVVCDHLGQILGTGHAFETKNSNYINKTSYVENCETSAVGRALGMCGFGIDMAICSAEELQNALNMQEAQKVQSEVDTAEKKLVSKEMLDALSADATKDNVDLAKVYAAYGIKKKADFTMKVFMQIKSEWKKVVETCGK